MKMLPAVKKQLLKQIQTKIATANNLQLKDIDFHAEIFNSLLELLDEESQVIVFQKLGLTAEKAKSIVKKIDKKRHLDSIKKYEEEISKMKTTLNYGLSLKQGNIFMDEDGIKHDIRDCKAGIEGFGRMLAAFKKSLSEKHSE